MAERPEYFGNTSPQGLTIEKKRGADAPSKPDPVGRERKASDPRR